MANSPGKRIPSLRLHRPSGQAVVRLVNPEGLRRDYYLGRHGSHESQERYQKLLARWIDGARTLPCTTKATTDEPHRTIEGLTNAYLIWARTYYLQPDGNPSGEVTNLERACKLLEEHSGTRHPVEFSPNRFREFRDSLVEPKSAKSGQHQRLSRNYINDIARRIKAVFKWGASRELIPASCYHRLTTVESLKAGRTKARETRGLGPISEQEVRATITNLSRQVAALVWFCWFTGARMGEAVQLCTRDIDRSGDVWLFRPAQHKNLHRGKERVIPIGLEAQRAVSPFMQLVPSRRWFRPCDTVAELRANRRPSLPPPQLATRLAKNARRRLNTQNRAAGKSYTTNAIQVAIRRACIKTGIPPWTPHRLRHSALTRIREQRGLEAAAAIGGHWTLNVTELYSQMAQQRLAVQIMRTLG
tara:strand:+ start:162 stop:1412 length:1251 start_codon:yes stop_codon:yes gene_type:complete